MHERNHWRWVSAQLPLPACEHPGKIAWRISFLFFLFFFFISIYVPASASHAPSAISCLCLKKMWSTLKHSLHERLACWKLCCPEEQLMFFSLTSWIPVSDAQQLIHVIPPRPWTSRQHCDVGAHTVCCGPQAWFLSVLCTLQQVARFIERPVPSCAWNMLTRWSSGKGGQL